MYCNHKIRVGWIATGLAVAWLGWHVITVPVYGQPEAESVHHRGDLIAIQLPGDSTGERVIIVDSQRRSIAVYHISKDQGKIRLESMRNIESDLRMTSFNSHSPTPEEVRLGLER
ncbi:MAG: hypothetical protein JW829_15770 [Pirellulales bacterium]|nr:hypothetical protein [Pirellulales bacterium]